MNVNCTGRGLQNEMGADRRGGGFRGVAQDRAFDHSFLGYVIGEVAYRRLPWPVRQMLCPNRVAKEQQKRREETWDSDTD